MRARVHQEMCSDGVARWLLTIGLGQSPFMTSGYYPNPESALRDAAIWVGGEVMVVPLKDRHAKPIAI